MKASDLRSKFYKPTYEELEADNRRLFGQMISKDRAFAMHKCSNKEEELKQTITSRESFIYRLQHKIERLQRRVKKLRKEQTK